MNLNELLPSRFLKQSDVEDEPVVTIAALKQVNVAPPDAPAEMKWVIQFDEFEKPLVANSTNLRLLGQFFGNETAGWMNQKVILYVDRSISFGGKLVGGIRLRNTKKPAPRKAATVQDANKALIEMDDDIPM